MLEFDAENVSDTTRQAVRRLFIVALICYAYDLSVFLSYFVYIIGLFISGC